MMKMLHYLKNGGGGVDFWDRKSLHFKKNIIVGMIFFSSISFTIWNLIDGLLFVKSLYRFPFFSPNVWWILFLIFIVILFIALVLFSIALNFSTKTTCLLVGVELVCVSIIYFDLFFNEKIGLMGALALFAGIILPILFFKCSKQLVSIIKWCVFVGTAVLLFMMGLLLSIAMSWAYISQTTDLDDYMTLDPAIDQQSIVEMFPSKDLVEFYATEGGEVSYEYSLRHGMFDSESTYSVVLEMRGIDPEEYEQLKKNLVQTYGKEDDSENEPSLLTVENHVKTDTDGYMFSICRSIEFDDECFGIIYSALQYYH